MTRRAARFHQAVRSRRVHVTREIYARALKLARRGILPPLILSDQAAPSWPLKPFLTTARFPGGHLVLILCLQAQSMRYEWRP